MLGIRKENLSLIQEPELVFSIILNIHYFNRTEEEEGEQIKEDDKLSTEEIDDEISLPLDTSMMSDDEDIQSKENLTKQNDLDLNKDDDGDDDSFWER